MDKYHRQQFGIRNASHTNSGGLIKMSFNQVGQPERKASHPIPEEPDTDNCIPKYHEFSSILQVIHLNSENVTEKSASRNQQSLTFKILNIKL